MRINFKAAWVLMRLPTAESEQIGRVFADVHDVRPTDFRALLHVMVAETRRQPITSGERRQRMGLSGAAITYLVDRMMASGHITRQSDPGDRRNVLLRDSDSGLDILPAVQRAYADKPRPYRFVHRVPRRVLASTDIDRRNDRRRRTVRDDQQEPGRRRPVAGCRNDARFAADHVGQCTGGGDGQ
jgi:DNA-binding MarR family transcriptional regulator